MQSQMYVPPLSKLNKYIIILYVALFILGKILLSNGINLSSYLALTSGGIKSGLIFQLITFPFIDTQFITVLFNCLILWFIGSELENKWSALFYVKFLGVVTYLPGVVFLLMGLIIGKSMNFVPYFGLNGLNLGLLVAYAMIFSERTMLFMFIFPMKAKYFCMLLAGIEMYMALSGNAYSSSWMHLLSMGLAYGYLCCVSYVARGGSLMAYKAKMDREKMKGKLTLIKNEEEEKPKSSDPKYWQ